MGFDHIRLECFLGVYNSEIRNLEVKQILRTKYELLAFTTHRKNVGRKFLSFRHFKISNSMLTYLFLRVELEMNLS